MADTIRVCPKEGYQRIDIRPLNAEFFKKFVLDHPVSDPTSSNYPIWKIICDTLVNIRKHSYRVHEWDAFLEEVPLNYRNLIAAVIVKCFGKPNTYI